MVPDDEKCWFAGQALSFPSELSGGRGCDARMTIVCQRVRVGQSSVGAIHVYAASSIKARRGFPSSCGYPGATSTCTCKARPNSLSSIYPPSPSTHLKHAARCTCCFSATCAARPEPRECPHTITCEGFTPRRRSHSSGASASRYNPAYNSSK